MKYVYIIMILVTFWMAFELAQSVGEMAAAVEVASE